MTRFILSFFILFTCPYVGHSKSYIPKKKISKYCPVERKFRYVRKFERHHTLGDYDGDGQEEMLYESLISTITHERIDSIVFYNEYGGLVDTVCRLDPVLELKTTNEIPDLMLSHGCQVFGLHGIVNLGDVNGRPGDEIALVVQWADWSNLNTCRIYSLAPDGWDLINTFSVHEYVFYNQDENDQSMEGVIEFYKGEWVYNAYDWEDGMEIWRKLKL